MKRQFFLLVAFAGAAAVAFADADLEKEFDEAVILYKINTILVYSLQM